MKRVFLVVFVAVIVSCNSNNSASTDSMSSSTDTTAQKINSPYPVQYSSDFSMGDPKNAESVLSLWKAWDNGDLSNSKDMFADTVEMHFANGAIMRASRDSALSAAQQARNSVGSAVSTVDAIMPVKSNDKDQNWALIWGKEVDTDNSGKVDSFYLQETWRFNKDGKADLFYQYRASATPPQQ